MLALYISLLDTEEQISKFEHMDPLTNAKKLPKPAVVPAE